MGCVGDVSIWDVCVGDVDVSIWDVCGGMYLYGMCVWGDVSIWDVCVNMYILCACTYRCGD